MKFENTRAMNFENAMHGMRNPMASWSKSDSWFGLEDMEDNEFSDYFYNITEMWAEKLGIKCYKNYADMTREEFEETYMGDPDPIILTDEFQEFQGKFLDNSTLKKYYDRYYEVAYIGPNDMDLAQRLIRAGSEHRKFMRQILVSVDITAPIYWQTNSFCQ